MISVPGFGGKKREPAEEVVRKLSSEGRSEREIINFMRREGYPNEEISHALNKVLKFRVTNKPQTVPAPRTASVQSSVPMRDIGQNFLAPPPEKPLEENVIEMTEEEEIGLEELVEEIIEEKWKDSMDELKDVEKAVVKLQEQVEFINEKIKHLEEKEEKKRDELKGLIEESSAHIENIESRIGSVEKGFKEFLPSLTENVRSLSAIVEKLKKEKSA